ncbi:MAG: glutaredoxin family protein [Patescibacteria group bacterium]
MDKKVVIYSTPSCQYCNLAKDFFRENDIPFEDYDVMTDEAKRAEMVEKSNQMGVPVIVIGEEVIIGFDKSRLAEMLGITEA